MKQVGRSDIADNSNPRSRRGDASPQGGLVYYGSSGNPSSLRYTDFTRF